ncbi:MAG: MBL fold metallo-hydrolase [Chitinispirillales bacterium]|jgi:glyoxylase-like metal-dependent hydrolase (beta-lactamase superfamily II)|nr:MBL fold metallo-hydrolase [Chitinispirillales bacterium]
MNRLVSSAFLFLFIAGICFCADFVILDGAIEVLAVEEVSGGTMGIELFDGGLLSKEQKLVYMPNGKAASSVNVFLVKTGNKTYLIDAGFGNAVKNNKIDVSKIDAIFLTHAHADHVSGLLKENGEANFSAPVFISKQENNYWLDAKTPNSDLQKNVAKAYAGRYKTFSFGETLAPEIIAIEAAGHTPGHTAFLIGTGKTKLLIAGDFLHAAALQFSHPDECAIYDLDRKKSIETRKKLMQMAADNKWLIAGMHIPMPGMGRILDNGKGGFDFDLQK